MEEIRIANVCRACLTDEGDFQSIFVPVENTSCKIHLAEMIMAYASVQITLGDGLPEQLCQTCAQRAVTLYLFKLRCEESDAILRQQLLEHSAEQETFHNLDYTNTVVIKPEISPDLLHETDDFDPGDVSDCPSEDALKCDECLRVFNQPGVLRFHKKLHLLKYPCDMCNKIFTRRHALVQHKRKHEPGLDGIATQELIAAELIEVKSEEIVENLKCAHCDTVCSSREELLVHTATHDLKVKSEEEDPLRCAHCKKKFKKTAHLTRHLKIHAEVKPHQCKLCNKSFARSEQFVNHMNVHSGIKPHLCSICNKGFNQVSNLKDHMRTHNGEKPFLCSMCGKGFNQLGNLRQHTIRHSGIKAHLCSTCGNGFASKGELCAHLRKHTGARPFVCHICNHGFTTSSSLTKHKRIHSGEKPYECDVCKMKFSRSGILARHKRTHTGEKPYVCKFCGKAFSQSNDLSSHLRIHTGEKPYICDVCGQAFRQSSALKTHKKTHIERSSILEIERSIRLHVPELVPLSHNAFVNAALP